MATATLNDQLWVTVLESADPLRIDPSCQLFLQAWIANAVDRMQSEERLVGVRGAVVDDDDIAQRRMLDDDIEHVPNPVGLVEGADDARNALTGQIRPPVGPR